MVCFIFTISLIFLLALRHPQGAALIHTLARRLHLVKPNLRGSLSLEPDALTLGSPRGRGCSGERRGIVAFSGRCRLGCLLGLNVDSALYLGHLDRCGRNLACRPLLLSSSDLSGLDLLGLEGSGDVLSTCEYCTA